MKYNIILNKRILHTIFIKRKTEKSKASGWVQLRVFNDKLPIKAYLKIA
jgi:hypothetical protein